MQAARGADGMWDVTLIEGDGIGPEVVGAAVQVLAAAGAPIRWHRCAAGAQVFRAGLASGVPAETIASIRETRVVLKGPLETPVGFGEKSANVTLRKLFETFANVRPVRTLAGVPTPFSARGVDLVVVRENVEDLYAGIEHQQTPEVAQCLKLMSGPGCERVVRLAFELARAEGRRSVHCATKANIMKFTEGLLKRTFEQVATEYPDIAAHHILVDNCAHQLVRAPEQFEVIVTSNMNGDILSDLTSGLVGGLGFAPGANLGGEVAIFEAVHGSAPTIAGQGKANPTAVILSAAMLVRHLGDLERAERIEAAVAAALAAGHHTFDVAPESALSTAAFTAAVIAQLDRAPVAAPARPQPGAARAQTRQALVVPGRSTRSWTPPAPRAWVGADVFVEAAVTPQALGAALESLAAEGPFRLKMISNRGTQVYPATGGETACVDHWRCRFVRRQEETALQDADLLALLAAVGRSFRWMHVEKLERWGAAPAYSRAQGED